MKYKVEVTTIGDNGSYASNGLRFDTIEAAELYAKDLASRWTSVINWRVIEVKE